MPEIREKIRFDAHYTRNDLVEFQINHSAEWGPAYVVRVGKKDIWLRPQGKQRVVKIRAGGNGAVRDLSEQAFTETRLGLPGPVLPEIRHVRTGDSPRRVTRARGRARLGAYLTFIRSRLCCACTTDQHVEAHHAGYRGVSQKADDYAAVPLCRSCHDTVTRTNCLRWGLVDLDATQTKEWILRAQVACLIGWCLKIEGARIQSPSERAADHLLTEALQMTATAGVR